jgi:hypothetical protein
VRVGIRKIGDGANCVADRLAVAPAKWKLEFEEGLSPVATTVLFGSSEIVP